MGFGGGGYQGPSESELAARRQEERAYNEQIRLKMREEAKADEDKRKAEEKKEREERAKWAADQEKKRLEQEQKALEAAGSADEADPTKKAVTTQQGGSFNSIQVDPSTIRPN